MKNFIKKLHETLVRSDKQVRIASSGSVKGSDHEKIRSGQAFLYQKSGMDSEVMQITFHKKVNGSMLNQALLESIRRYPYLNTKLVELDGDFYIVQNDIQPVARKTDKLAALGDISCGYHLIDVTFHERSIYVSWHHALCDGKGIKPFIETLIYYYCKLRYGSKSGSENIRLSDAPLLEGETAEPNLEVYSYDETRETISVSRDAYAIPENVPEDHDTDYRYEIRIPADRFMNVCKSSHATPVVMASLLMSRGIAGLYPDFDKPINANIAVDIRDALDLPNTFKNCVRSMPLPFDREMLVMSLSEQAQKQRAILNAQRDRDLCRKLSNASMAMFDKLDELHSYQEKQELMGFFNGMLLNTYVISYLGKVILNENAQYIESMFFYNSGACGLGITMLDCGNEFCLCFKQSFESDKYVEAFCEGLRKLDVHYEASSVIPFLTPKDRLIKRSPHQ